MRSACLLALPGLAVSALAMGGSEVPCQTVRFEIDHVTTVGQSVFVRGDIPELGDDRMRYAVKLVPGTYDPGPPESLVWQLDVAIPYGTTYTWDFVVRDDDVPSLSIGSNGTSISAPVTDSTTAPDPNLVDLVVYKNNAGPILEMTFSTPAGDLNAPFRPVPGHPDLLAARQPDQPFGPGTLGEINGKDIDIPLHTSLRRGAHMYNYLSDPAASNLDGRVERFAVPSAFIPATATINNITGRGIQIYLPRGYDDHTTRSYPVLYMHDGQNVFEPGGPFGTWSAEVTAAALIKAGTVREVIIVAIDNHPNRLIEYNPEWPDSVNDDYNDFIVSELIPHVNSNYRTLTDREHTGICGSSFGGVASLSLGINHPDVFGLVAALSTSFWATTFDDQLAAGAIPNTRLYLDVGDINDGAEASIAARDGALAAGRVLQDNLFFQVGYGQQHNEAAWSQRFDDVLLALYPLADEANTLALPVPVPGDANVDGCVDLLDFAELMPSFGACDTAPEYDFASDHDNSGCIDLGDLAIQLASFEAGCP